MGEGGGGGGGHRPLCSPPLGSATEVIDAYSITCIIMFVTGYKINVKNELDHSLHSSMEIVFPSLYDYCV